MDERRGGGSLPSTNEMLTVVSEAYLAPITYARELKERCSRPGGFIAEARGLVIASLPTLIPLASAINTGIGNESVAKGILAGVLLWTLSGSIIRALHVTGVIGPNSH